MTALEGVLIERLAWALTQIPTPADPQSIERAQLELCYAVLDELIGPAGKAIFRVSPLTTKVNKGIISKSRAAQTDETKERI
jgi:hypothetical protein